MVLVAASTNLFRSLFIMNRWHIKGQTVMRFLKSNYEVDELQVLLNLNS